MRRFLRLSAADRGLVLRAVAAVLAVRMALLFRGGPPWRRALAGHPRPAGAAAAGGNCESGHHRGLTLPDRVAWAVRAVSRRIPGASCLTQALAARRLLARAGRTAHLRLGVKKTPDGSLAAHAWVECDGRTLLADERETAEYLPLEGTEREARA